MTGETPYHHVHGLYIAVYGSYILVTGHVGPVALQYLLAVRVNLHLPHTLEAELFHRKVQATNTAEKASEPQESITDSTFGGT